MRKRYVAFVLALTMVLAATGCSKSQAETSTTETSAVEASTNETSAADTVTATEEAQEETTVYGEFVSQDGSSVTVSVGTLKQPQDIPADGNVPGQPGDESNSGDTPPQQPTGDSSTPPEKPEGESQPMEKGTAPAGNGDNENTPPEKPEGNSQPADQGTIPADNGQQGTPPADNGQEMEMPSLLELTGEQAAYAITSDTDLGDLSLDALAEGDVLELTLDANGNVLKLQKYTMEPGMMDMPGGQNSGA